MNAWAQHEGQPGLGYIFWREGEESGAGPLAQESSARSAPSRSPISSGSASATPCSSSPASRRQFVKFAGPARTKVGEELDLIDKDRFDLCWIVDFPMYEWNEEEKKIDFSHNPFSMPNMDVDEFLKLDPKDNDKLLGIKAIQYDIVCNGVELSSGAIRNHRPDVMKKAFAIAGYPEDVLEAKFGGMLRALSLGAPPHGGIAPGIDRIVMLLCGEENLREVVLFPMNQRAEDLLMGAPSEVTPKQLRELHIRLNLPDKNSLRRGAASLRRCDGDEHGTDSGHSGLCPHHGGLQRRDEPAALRRGGAHPRRRAAAGPRRVLGLAARHALPSAVGRPDVDVAVRRLAEARGDPEGQRRR